jgi:hypothetical protein
VAVEVPVVPVAEVVGGGVAVVVPAVELGVDPLLTIASARMKPLLGEAAVVLAELSCTQPVTVTVFSSVFLLVVVVALCAVSAAVVVAHAIAAAIQNVRFISPPRARGVQARYLLTEQH